MQFVWVYWHRGAQEDELRWSIRSVLKNYQGDATIMVVGDKPPWYTGPHIPIKRIRGAFQRAFRDSLNKLTEAVKRPEIESQFVWMMDDIYLVQGVSEQDIKTRYFQSVLGDSFISRSIDPSRQWQSIKQNTCKALKREGFQLRDYATHLPQFIEKSKFQKIVNRFSVRPSNPSLVLWEMIYGNVYPAISKPVGNVRFRSLNPLPSNQWKAGASKSKFLNNGNRAWNNELRSVLVELLPEKSDYENDEAQVSTPIAIVIPWRKHESREKSYRWVFNWAREKGHVVRADSPGRWHKAEAWKIGIEEHGDVTDDTIYVFLDADCAITNHAWKAGIEVARDTKRLVIPHTYFCAMTKNQSSQVTNQKCPYKGPRGTWFRSNRAKTANGKYQKAKGGIFMIRGRCLQTNSGMGSKIPWLRLLRRYSAHTSGRQGTRRNYPN